MDVKGGYFETMDRIQKLEAENRELREKIIIFEHMGEKTKGLLMECDDFSSPIDEIAELWGIG